MHPPTVPTLATHELPSLLVKCRTASSLMLELVDLLLLATAQQMRIQTSWLEVLLVRIPQVCLLLPHWHYFVSNCCKISTSYLKICSAMKSTLLTSASGKLRFGDRISLSTHSEKSNSPQNFDFLGPWIALPLGFRIYFSTIISNSSFLLLSSSTHNLCFDTMRKIGYLIPIAIIDVNSYNRWFD